MEKWIMENPYMVLGLAGVLVVLVIIFATAFSSKKKKEKNRLLNEDENLVELMFDYLVSEPNPLGGGALLSSAGYSIYSVNASKPKIFGRSILVPAGEVTLEYEYVTETANGRKTTSYGKRTYKFMANKGKKYKMSFNYIDKELEHKEQ